MHILHVESDSSYHHWVVEELEKLHTKHPPLTFVSARSVSEAINTYINSSCPFDIILLNLTLPDADTYSALDNIYAVCGEIPIIVVDKQNDDLSGVDSLSRGAHDFINQDTCTPLQLYQSINFALGRARKFQSRMQNFDNLELAVESAGVGLWDWNLVSNDVTINEQWATIAGYQLDELRPFCMKKLLAMMPDEDIKTTLESLKSHWEGAVKIYRSEYRIKHKQGHFIWVEDSGRVVSRYKDKPTRMTGIHRDISERKAKENEFKKLSRIARESINGVSLPINTAEWNGSTKAL